MDHLQFWVVSVGGTYFFSLSRMSSTSRISSSNCSSPNTSSSCCTLIWPCCTGLGWVFGKRAPSKLPNKLTPDVASDGINVLESAVPSLSPVKIGPTTDDINVSKIPRSSGSTSGSGSSTGADNIP